MSDLEAPPVVTRIQAINRLFDLCGGTTVVLDRLLDIIVWEAKRFNGNAPLFATELPTGRPLPEGQRRAETWRAIFGEPRREAPQGAWVQCPQCRGWSVHHPESNRSINDDDAQVIARALIGRTR